MRSSLRQSTEVLKTSARRAASCSAPQKSLYWEPALRENSVLQQWNQSLAFQATVSTSEADQRRNLQRTSGKWCLNSALSKGYCSCSSQLVTAVSAVNHQSLLRFTQELGMEITTPKMIVLKVKRTSQTGKKMKNRSLVRSARMKTRTQRRRVLTARKAKKRNWVKSKRRSIRSSLRGTPVASQLTCPSTAVQQWWRSRSL